MKETRSKRMKGRWRWTLGDMLESRSPRGDLPPNPNTVKSSDINKNEGMIQGKEVITWATVGEWPPSEEPASPLPKNVPFFPSSFVRTIAPYR